MAPWKQGDLPGLRSRQGQALEGFGGKSFCEVAWQPQFAQALLQPDLPKRDGTDEDGVLRVADHLPGCCGKRGTVIQPPEQQVRVV